MPIKIDADEIIMAMDDHSGMCSFYLDRDTGTVVFMTEGEFPDAEAELRRQMEDSPGRFIWIEPMPSREGFRIMEDFVDQLPEGGDKRLLEKALSWKKPFSNFKSALADMGPLRDQWFAFRDERMCREIQDWFEANEIDVQLVRRVKKRAEDNE